MDALSTFGNILQNSFRKNDVITKQKIQIKCNITSKTMKNRKIKGCRQIFIKSQTLQTLDFIRFMEGYMMF